MQAPRSRPDQFGKPRFHIHVDVFEPCREREFPGFDLRADSFQTLGDRLLVGRRNDAFFRQHLAMRDRTGDVLRIELLVEAD